MVRSKSSWITDCAICAASFGWPITFGTGRGPQPSSAGVNSGRGADRERRDHVEAERGGVIVVDEKDDVGLVILQPLLGIFVAREDRLPVWLGRLAEVERRADRGHMRGVDAAQ